MPGSLLLGIAVLLSFGAAGNAVPGTPAGDGYVGSAGCRACHEPFYSLWSTSMHGLAMRAYDPDFAGSLRPQETTIRVEGMDYRAHTGPGEGYVRETGPSGEKEYPISYVLGGKNVCFFLTPLERGRLQTLPLAYDVERKAWFDMARGGVRHALGAEGQAMPWRDALFTFNTGCYGCHVSQLSTNYDVASDTYHTTWKESGINCETCHGPGEEHVRVCTAAGPGAAPKDLRLKLIRRDRGYNAEQVSAGCGSCHAKLLPLTAAYVPGEDFFQHYDLMGLEDADFYPDGRDLGENYTYTGWRLSRCAQSGQVDCLHCHTSSGRNRFAAADKANDACLPCHETLVKNAAAHSHHAADGAGNRCVACHMAGTRFAGMQRSDHSMRAPMPAATQAFGSPNACNQCHPDKDAAWANEWAVKWYGGEYQRETLRVGGLVAAARKSDWTRLDEMLSYLLEPKRDEVFAASLLRLLRPCEDAKKWPVLESLATKDTSPLVRARAAEALGDALSGSGLTALVTALSDPFRLVRVRAAAALAPVDPDRLEKTQGAALRKASAEFVAAMSARADDFSSYYNLGVFHADRGEFEQAAAAYDQSSRLRGDVVGPLVNASMAYAALGKAPEAEERLRRAIRIDGKALAAWVNLGLLLGEQGRVDEAAKAYEQALALDGATAVAAYNLGIIRGRQGRLEEALRYCGKACELEPKNPAYAKTLAYYRHEAGL